MDRKTIEYSRSSYPQRPRDIFLREAGDDPDDTDESIPGSIDAPVTGFKRQNAENLAVQAGYRTPTNSAISRAVEKQAAERKRAEHDLCYFSHEMLMIIDAAAIRRSQEEEALYGQSEEEEEKEEAEEKTSYMEALRDEWEGFTENIGDFTKKATNAACCAFRKASAAAGTAVAPFQLALLYSSLSRQGAFQPDTVKSSPQAAPYIRYDSV